jgi:flagellar hook-basal body complex protein FliE
MPMPIGQPLSAVLPRIERPTTPAQTPNVGLPKVGALGSTTDAANAPSFAERLQEFVGQVDQSQRESEFMATEYAAGRNDDLHGTMLTMQQADIRLHLFANIRNKVIEAYKEISRMGA